jgi:hypothetical protein
MVVILFFFPSREHRVWKRRLQNIQKLGYHMLPHKSYVTNSHKLPCQPTSPCPHPSRLTLNSSMMEANVPSQSVGCRSQDGAKWDLRSGDETHRLVMRKKHSGKHSNWKSSTNWSFNRNIISLSLRGWFQLQRLIIGEYIEQNPNVPIVEDKTLVSNYSVHPLGSPSWLTIFVCEFSGSSPTSHGPWSLRWRCQLALHRRCSIPFKPFVLAGCKQFTNLFGN